MSGVAEVRQPVVEGLEELLGGGWRDMLPVAEVASIVEARAPHLRRYALALTVDDDIAVGMAEVSEEQMLGYTAHWTSSGGDPLIAESLYWRWALEQGGLS